MLIFENLTSLPLDIIARIIAYLPRCILPEILSFARIRDIVASEILSAVDITDWTRNCYKTMPLELEPPIVFVMCLP